MKPVPFAVGMAFIAAGIGSVLVAGNGLAAIAFVCGAVAVYVLAGEYQGNDGAVRRPRRRIDPVAPGSGPPDTDLSFLRFRPRTQGTVHEPSVVSSDPGLRIVVVVAAVTVTLASLAYAARFIAEQRDRAQAVELVQKFAEDIQQMGEVVQRDLERSQAEAVARRRSEAIRRDQAMPYYPPPAQVPAGQRACMNGTAVLREPNGWSEVLTSSGRPQPCRNRR